MTTERQEYQLQGTTFSEVTEEIQKIWGQMQQPGSQPAKGIDSGEFEQLKKRSVADVLVLDKGSAFAGEAVLIVSFAPVAAKITKDVWDNFILPRLIRRFGPKAITPKKGRK